MQKLTFIFIGMVLAAFPAFSVIPTAFAYEEADSALSKFERGVINTTTGWMEVGVQPSEGYKSAHPVTGTLFGVGKGIFKGLQRMGTGLVDIVTFPLPPYDSSTAEPETLFGNPR